LPFLLPGYGTDPDAWRVGVAAKVMRETGQFASSRVPGHPVQELAPWWLSGLGALGINLVTALLSVIATLLFHRVARRLALPHPFLLALGFAFLPIVFVHSVDAMDYLWALAFALAAVELVLAGKPALAGGCLGIATGCRLTSIALLVALVPLLEPGRRVRDGVRMAVVALVVGAFCFIPVLATYGPGYLRFTPTHYPRALYIAKAFTIDLFGVVGLAGLVVALIGPWNRAGAPAWRRMHWATLAALAVYIVLFLRLPDDAAYLLPVIPFVLWSLATLLPPKRVAILALALAASGFVLRLREARVFFPPVDTGPSVRIGKRLVLDLPGPIFVDHARRVAQDAYADTLLRRLPPGATLLSAEWWPVLVVKGAGQEVVQYPTAAQLDSLARRPLYYVPTAENEIHTKTGLDVQSWGARPLR